MRNLKLFESKKIRSEWNEEEEKLYFSVIDIIEVLTDSSVPKRYWSDLKKKLELEGSEVYDKIVRLKRIKNCSSWWHYYRNTRKEIEEDTGKR